MKETTSIAAFVKFSREKLKLTQEQLAEMSGVGIHFIRDLEQGKSSLRMDKVNNVLDAFGFRLAPSVEVLDPYKIWFELLDKPVKIITKNNEEIYGFLIREVRDEKSNIVAWKVVLNPNAIEWQKKPDDKLTIEVRQDEIAEIDVQERWKNPSRKK